MSDSAGDLPRFLAVTFAFFAAVVVSACDFWPKDLEPLAHSISQQVSGETTAWLLAGDVLVIEVAGSPFYRADQSELEALATEVARESIAFSAAPLESISITFHEREVSEDPETMRDFIFLVMENQPVLQPTFDVDATGPLTPGEIQAAIDRLGDSLTVQNMECVRREMEEGADAAGDPEALDPASLEFLPTESWNVLDAFGKRIILAQAITTQAVFACASK